MCAWKQGGAQLAQGVCLRSLCALSPCLLDAGLALVGPLPDYVRPSLRTLWLAAVYRLRWAASLANLGVKGRVQTNRHASDELKHELLLHDWHFGAVPDYVVEVSGQQHLLQQLRSLARPILALAPTHWAPAATALLRFAPMAEVVLTRGVKDEQAATFAPDRVAQIAAQVERFAAGAFTLYDEMISAHREAAAMPPLCRAQELPSQRAMSRAALSHATAVGPA